MDGESEAISLMRAMVRVLAKNDDFNLIKIGGKCGKDLLLRWIDSLGGISGSQKLRQLFEIGLAKFMLENGLPGWMHLNSEKLAQLRMNLVDAGAGIDERNMEILRDVRIGGIYFLLEIARLRFESIGFGLLAGL